MVHGEFGFYAKCSGHPIRLVENMEMTCSGLRDERINLAEVSVDHGAKGKVRKPVTLVQDDGGFGLGDDGGDGEKWSNSGCILEDKPHVFAEGRKEINQGRFLDFKIEQLELQQYHILRYGSGRGTL